MIILILMVTFTTLTQGVYIPPGPKYKCPERNVIWPCLCISTSDDGVVIRCEQVSLATLAAALTYPRVQRIPIQVLELVELNTEKLYGKLFRDVNITRLRIENSPIVNILPDIFFNIRHSLETLELVGTSIEKYPNEALHELENLHTLVLDKHNISDLNDRIRGLGSLKNLQISNGNISSLSKETFAGLGKLARLSLHGNRLTTKAITKDMLSTLKSLEYLDVAFNEFDKLNPDMFFHLSKCIDYELIRCRMILMKF